MMVSKLTLTSSVTCLSLLCLSLSSANSLTPDPLSPNDTSMSFSMAPFKTVPYQPAASASFVISDVTDEEDVVSIVSELMPDPPPLPNVSAFMTTFDLDRPSMDFREAEEDMVLLSKSTSFADVMDILKDMNRMKMSEDRPVPKEPVPMETRMHLIDHGNG